jgi:hypothetical protein
VPDVQVTVGDRDFAGVRPEALAGAEEPFDGRVVSPDAVPREPGEPLAGQRRPYGRLGPAQRVPSKPGAGRGHEPGIVQRAQESAQLRGGGDPRVVGQGGRDDEQAAEERGDEHVQTAAELSDRAAESVSRRYDATKESVHEAHGHGQDEENDRNAD